MKHFPLWIVLSVCWLVIVGCEEQERITSYTVPKEPPLGETDTVPAAPAEPQVATPSRLLGAIVPHDEQTWFFKLMGPEAPIAAQQERFTQFVSSIHFTDKGMPAWALPEGWREQRSSGGSMRFATIRTGSEKDSPELTIIPLPTGPDPQENILANVNRWRDQLALPPIKADELPTETETIPVGDDAATVVNITGKAKPNTMGRPPFAGR